MLLRSIADRRCRFHCSQGFKDAYEERLAAFFAHQIRSDPSLVYGEGFRCAHAAFQTHGLAAVLEHVRATGAFPT